MSINYQETINNNCDYFLAEEFITDVQNQTLTIHFPKFKINCQKATYSVSLRGRSEWNNVFEIVNDLTVNQLSYSIPDLYPGSEYIILIKDPSNSKFRKQLKIETYDGSKFQNH